MNQKLFLPQLIIRKGELKSTNDFALNLIKTDDPLEGTVVLTQKQTKGRGQRNNFWESETGKNLTISIIFKPEFLQASNQFQISMVISLGVYDYLRIYLSNVSVKWPNDMYVGEEKIAGILIEHSILGSVLSHSICGIGLNVNQQKFFSDAPNPTSLAIQTNNQYDLNAELEQLLECIETRYLQLKSGQARELETDYLNAMYRMNEHQCFEDKNGSFEGKITGVTEWGQLRVDVKGEERIYNFKEVRFV